MQAGIREIAQALLQGAGQAAPQGISTSELLSQVPQGVASKSLEGGKLRDLLQPLSQPVGGPAYRNMMKYGPSTGAVNLGASIPTALGLGAVGAAAGGAAAAVDRSLQQYPYNTNLPDAVRAGAGNPLQAAADGARFIGENVFNDEAIGHMFNSLLGGRSKGLTRDNDITNGKVLKGKLPARNLEIYPNPDYPNNY